MPKKWVQSEKQGGRSPMEGAILEEFPAFCPGMLGARNIYIYAQPPQMDRGFAQNPKPGSVDSNLSFY